MKRHAWQIRFFTDPQMFVRGLNKAYPGMGDKYTNRSEHHVKGPKYPLLWPQTQPEEDVLRRNEHMTLSHYEWAQLMIRYPKHLLVTNIVRAVVKSAETFGIL